MFSKQQAVVAAAVIGASSLLSPSLSYAGPLVSQLVPSTVLVPPQIPVQPPRQSTLPLPSTPPDQSLNDAAIEARTLLQLATGAEARGKLSSAIELYKQVVQTAAKLGTPSTDAAIANGRIAALCADMGRPTLGIRYAKNSLMEFQKLEGPVNNDVAIELNNLAWLEQKAGNSREAEKLYRQSLSVLQASQDENEDLRAITENNLADLLILHHQYGDAFKHYQNGYAHAKAYYGADNPLTRMISKKLIATRHTIQRMSAK